MKPLQRTGRSSFPPFANLFSGSVGFLPQLARGRTASKGPDGRRFNFGVGPMLQSGLMALFAAPQQQRCIIRSRRCIVRAFAAVRPRGEFIKADRDFFDRHPQSRELNNVGFRPCVPSLKSGSDAGIGANPARPIVFVDPRARYRRWHLQLVRNQHTPQFQLVSDGASLPGRQRSS